MSSRWQVLALLFGVRVSMAFQFQAVAALMPLVMGLLGFDLLSAVGVAISSAGNNGPAYGTFGPTENYAGLDGGVDCPGGPPGTGVTRDFCVNNATVGVYDAKVLSVTKDGYTWDGSTPENSKDFLGKQ